MTLHATWTSYYTWQKKQKNATTSKESDNNLISANCEVIIIFPIYGQFGRIRKPDSRNVGS